jgi:voltage-gated potassium channel
MINKTIDFFSNHIFTTVGVAVIIMLSIGTLFYHNVEHVRYFDALYFSAMTLTTVGFGDFAPKTDIGKAFTIIYVFSGVGIMGSYLTTIAMRQQKAWENGLKRRRKNGNRNNRWKKIFGKGSNSK